MPERIKNASQLVLKNLFVASKDMECISTCVDQIVPMPERK
jgi:hypothetical protein